jgi:hypothetical protein
MRTRVLDSVPQQHCAAFHNLAALQRHRRDGGSVIGLRLSGVAPNPIPAVKGIESEREEIRQRVATFKAHQQRFIRERKDYAASEWNRMLASQR